MSSFLHSCTHFNSVEKALINLILDQNMYHLPYKLKTLLPDSSDRLKEKGKLELIDLMNTIRNISVLTTNLQYKEHSENEYNMLMLDTKTSVNIDLVTLLKALESINYQIEIEHLTALRPLSKKEEATMFILSELINSIALHIIGNSDEYNKSKGWSL